MKTGRIILVLIVLAAIAVPAAGYFWLCSGAAHGMC